MPSPRLPRLLRAARLPALALIALSVMGFVTEDRIANRGTREMPREFRLVVVEGVMTPSEANFRREGRRYINEAPVTTGDSLLSATWFAIHKTDADAVLLEYPSRDAAGNAVYRQVYALEEQRNRYRLYRVDVGRLDSALNDLESSIRRNDASRREENVYNNLVAIWNANNAYSGEMPSNDFHVSGRRDINALIDFSRNLDQGEKIIVSTGDVLDLYVY